MNSAYDFPEKNMVPKDARVSPGLELPEPFSVLDFNSIYGNTHPVEIEIGYGKGLFLLHSGYRYPDINFLGVEYARKYYVKACERIEKWPVKNIKLVHAEAFEFLRACIPDNSIQKIHLYFPDPWPKKRHFKRRLFQMPFISLAHQKLKEMGHLCIATDHKGYWEWMSEILDAQSLLTKADFLPEPPLPENQGLTNYDIKYQKEGREIYRAVYRKEQTL